MKRKIISLTAFFLSVTLLAGCSEKPNQESDTSQSAVGNIAADEGETTPKDPAELSFLRSQIQEADCTVGIAFVDFLPNELPLKDTATYLAHSETAKKHPFVNDINTVAYDGIELFVLVPANTESAMTVYPVDLTDEGEFKIGRDEFIYQGMPGEPIVLRCNTNENYANVLISVTNGEECFEFYPMISLMDGWSVAPVEGCYDFSIDNIRKYTDDLYSMLPQTYPEIQEALDEGSDLIFAGDFYFCNQMMLRFEVGRFADSNGEYFEEGFICDKQYAVSFDATYAMDSDDSRWYVIGAGLMGMGIVS